MQTAIPAENEQIVRRLFEEGFNGARSDVIDQLVAQDYTDGTGQRGPGALEQVMTRLRGAFPDIRYTVQSVLADGDQVAIRWRWSGTHRGSFRGLAATGRSLTNSGVALFRLREGKIVAADIETDRLGFLQAIGLVPGDDVLFRSAAAPPSK